MHPAQPKEAKMNRRDRALQDYCDWVQLAVFNGLTPEIVVSMRMALLKISKRHFKDLCRNKEFMVLWCAVSSGVDNWEIIEGYTDELSVSPQVEVLKKTLGVGGA
jgi:CRISPR/Cas system-associated endoribonuclease Cas2